MYSLVKAGKPKWRIQQQLRLNARPSTLTWYERWLARNLESDTFFSPPGLQNGQQPHWFRRSYVLQNSSDGSLKAWRTSLPEQDQDSPNGNRTVGTRCAPRLHKLIRLPAMMYTYPMIQAPFRAMESVCYSDTEGFLQGRVSTPACDFCLGTFPVSLLFSRHRHFLVPELL